MVRRVFTIFRFDHTHISQRIASAKRNVNICTRISNFLSSFKAPEKETINPIINKLVSMVYVIFLYASILFDFRKIFGKISNFYSVLRTSFTMSY